MVPEKRFIRPKDALKLMGSALILVVSGGYIEERNIERKLKTGQTLKSTSGPEEKTIINFMSLSVSPLEMDFI